jgi:hypothetical protein
MKAAIALPIFSLSRGSGKKQGLWVLGDPIQNGRHLPSATGAIPVMPAVLITAERTVPDPFSRLPAPAPQKKNQHQVDQQGCQCEADPDQQEQSPDRIGVAQGEGRQKEVVVEEEVLVVARTSGRTGIPPSRLPKEGMKDMAHQPASRESMIRTKTR